VEKVVILQPQESIEVDFDRLVEIYEHMGATGEQGKVVRTVESVGGQLELIEGLYLAGNFQDVAVCAERLIALAQNIGMQSVVRVAETVSDCAQCGNAAALGATIARLARIGGASLEAIIDPPELVL
jgi:hypothetical protein